jgi:TPR repeat protein
MPTRSRDESLQEGLRYLIGEEIQKDERKARELLLEAAEADEPTALFLAYEMLAHGQGGPFDRVRAFRYLQRAADLGEVDAIYSLGFCYMNGGMGNIGYSKAVLKQQVIPVDIEKGLKLLHTAAAQGHDWAALRIAQHYENEADDDPEMLKRAVEWYEKGMALGEDNCLVHLGDFYILGKSVEKNHEKARMLYEQAAKSDDVCAKRAGQDRLQHFADLESILIR